MQERKMKDKTAMVENAGKENERPDCKHWKMPPMENGRQKQGAGK